MRKVKIAQIGTSRNGHGNYIYENLKNKKKNLTSSATRCRRMREKNFRNA